MTLKTDAWVIHKGEGKDPGKAELKRETFEIPALGPEHVYARPLYGCWEGNMGHIIDRKPVDVAAQRGEDRIVMGNAGVVEIIEVGDEDRKSTRLNSSHVDISYAVFCLKKKKTQ